MYDSTIVRVLHNKLYICFHRAAVTQGEFRRCFLKIPTKTFY